MMFTTTGVTFVGGKFTNGALTGAFSRLFNDLGGAYQRVRSAVNELTASLPVLPQGLVDGAAGFGDGMSFGATVLVRNWMGTNHVVDMTSGAYYGGAATGIAVHGIGFRIGGELSIGRNFRLAPWGNRTGHPSGRLPHYHRRGVSPSGQTRPGQGIGRHRPWDTKSTDRSFMDRF